MSTELTSFDGTLTTGDMAAIAGTTTTTVVNYGDDGLFPGTDRGRGQGHFRQYSLMDAVALTLGVRHRDVGVPYPWVKALVCVVARLGPEDVERAVGEGRTLVVPLPGQPGEGLLLQPDPAKPVATALLLDNAIMHVLKEVVRLRQPRNATGRSRGLAGGPGANGTTGGRGKRRF